MLQDLNASCFWSEVTELVSKSQNSEAGFLTQHRAPPTTTCCISKGVIALHVTQNKSSQKTIPTRNSTGAEPKNINIPYSLPPLVVYNILTLSGEARNKPWKSYVVLGIILSFPSETLPKAIPWILRELVNPDCLCPHCDANPVTILNF